MLSNSTLVGLRGEALIPIPDRSNKEVVNRDTPKVGEFWAIMKDLRCRKSFNPV
jgi:hypothetical protein